jgi:Tol biopolymer transport system component
MSPEQAGGQAVDQRSDIFSFGCVLYEMLQGARAFRGETTADLTGSILKDDPELSSITPPGLQRIVAHCLEKSPEQRFQSAGDIGFALEAITLQDTGPQRASAARKPNWMVYLLAASVLLSATLAYLYFRPTPGRSFHRLTFRRGKIHGARFTPDGNGVVYSAQWEDEPSEIFTARLESAGSRALGFSGSTLEAISASGELALTQNRRIGGAPFGPIGMLARAPFSGGAARPVEDNISFADWSPSGAEMALVRETDQGVQLEFPPGKILYATAGYVSEPRVSPDGNKVAFLDHPLANDNRGTVAVVDRAGKKQTLSKEFLAGQGLAWSPKGDEVWFTASDLGARYELQAVTLTGRQRVVYSAPVGLVLQDIWRDGRVLVSNVQQRTKLMFRGAADARERELSWLDWSLLDSVSPDGKLVVFTESGEGAGGGSILYLRETNGAPALLLGHGNPSTLSPDGKWVVSNDTNSATLLIYPVGPGQLRRLPLPGFTIELGGLLPGGQEIWFNGNEPSRGTRYYLVSIGGGKPRPITPEGVRYSSMGAVLSSQYLAGRTGGRTVLYPVRGGEPQFLEGVNDQERIAGWSDDGQAVFIYSRNDYPAKVRRVDRKTGKQQLIREITTSDRAGMNFGINVIQMTSDGKTYAYSFLQELSELHLVEGLK